LKNNIKNILILNTGGGLGDSLQHLTLFNYLNENINPDKIYFFSTDGKRFWYDNILKEFAPKNLEVVKTFPMHFGFQFRDHLYAKKLINSFDFEKFDLIIDNQTRITNTLMYKRIPHKYFISPCYSYFFSKPFFLMKKPKHAILRIINYLNKLLKINESISYNLTIPENYLAQAKKILNPKDKYVGFSITSAHRQNIKEFNFDEIFEVANYFASKDLIPIFFIDNTRPEIKNRIKESVKNCMFPEDMADKEFKNPMLVTALGSLTEFNISINNGIYHMLNYSNKKTYMFAADLSEKFKSLHQDFKIFNGKAKKMPLSKLSSSQIINFIENN